MMSSSMDAAQGGEVLVVDDTAESLEYLCAFLRSQGYVVRAAPSGELALWTAFGKPPDLILLDVRMPEIDGFEVCRRLKADPRTAAIPVIFLSAQTDIEDKIQGFRAGGVDYIGKPFDSDEVLQRVATQVRLARVSRELEKEKTSLEDRVRERTATLERTAQALRQEIAAHNLAEEKLRLAASAFEASLSGMFIANAEGVITTINPAFTTVTGYAADESCGRNIRFFIDAEKHEDAFFDAMWAKLRSNGHWTGELWNRRKDGNEVPCLFTLTAIRDDQGNVDNYVGVFLDLSERKDAQTLIEFLTHHDSLTGLPNRILVHDRFDQLTKTVGAQELVAVICINLDRFRQINDFHGYMIGNEVLQWVAQQFADLLPTQDTVYREGADEFVLVHHDEAGLMGIRLLIEAIQMRLVTDLRLDDVQIAMSVSLGIALYPDDGRLLEDLVANASLAMARAKENGGGGHAFFTETIDHGVRVRFEMAQHLRRALEHKEFEVYYQPQVDAASARIVAAEALLRWHSPTLGFVSPAVFIPIAEETGYILEIGRWVLRSVCEQIALWRGQGLGDIKVAVNLSGRQFMQDDIVDIVSVALADSGIPPACLELEITESAIIDDVQKAIATMQQLKKLGIAMSLDDFGTGYSSLSYLKKFPIDYLKIDQSFVRDLDAEQDANAIVLSIINLAYNMRMNVIAEGVETHVQRDFLAANGCDLLQGYLFSKPVPRDQFEAMLLSRVKETASGAVVQESP